MVLLFISKHTDINVVHCFYFLVIFLCHWIGNIRIIQFFDVLFIAFFNPLRMYFLWVQVSSMAPPKALIIFILKIDQSFRGVSELWW